MSGENWESLITEKGFIRVPRALRLKRAELGITNNEYTILLDYVDYYSFSGTVNPYRHLSEVSGMSERSIKKVLASLEKKGLLRRKVSSHGNGRTSGVVFSLVPLVKKLKAAMKKSSSTVGEENDTHVHEESFTPNTGEEFNKKDERENTPAKNAVVGARGYAGARINKDGTKGYETAGTDFGFIRETGGPRQEAPRNDRLSTDGTGAGQIHLAREAGGPQGLFPGMDYVESSQEIAAVAPGFALLPSSPIGYAVTSRREKQLPRNDRKAGGRDPYSASRWYNEVWRGLYEEAAGQPALTGSREYKAADLYFRRLRALNPDMESDEIFLLAGEGAAFMIASQLEGGVFGWIHKPPDICMLASQAQSVEWHLRKMRRGAHQRDNSEKSSGSPPSSPSPLKGEGINDCNVVAEKSETSPVFVEFIEKIREVQNAGQEIDRVYGELRGIESASRGRAIQPVARTLRRKRA